MKLRRGVLILVILLSLAACTQPAQTGTDNNNDADRAEEARISDGFADGQAPQDTDQSLIFLFFSDTQANPEFSDYSDIGKLLESALLPDDNAEAVIFGGDSINDGGNAAEWSAFRLAIDPFTGGLITAAVAGNHDNYALLAEQFDYPGKAPSSREEGYFYSFRTGPVFFIMLDSNTMGAANQADIDWLRRDLQSEDSRMACWRIAVIHHPMWPVADIPKDIQRAETMREYFLPILEEYGVRLVLCGHQHVYARTLPMSGDAASSDESGIIQIMAASGDKASYIPGEHDYIAACAPAPNYLSVFADHEQLIITAYDGEHCIIDETVIRR